MANISCSFVGVGHGDCSLYLFVHPLNLSPTTTGDTPAYGPPMLLSLVAVFTSPSTLLFFSPRPRSNFLRHMTSSKVQRYDFLVVVKGLVKFACTDGSSETERRLQLEQFVLHYVGGFGA